MEIHHGGAESAAILLRHMKPSSFHTCLAARQLHLLNISPKGHRAGFQLLLGQVGGPPGGRRVVAHCYVLLQVCPHS